MTINAHALDRKLNEIGYACFGVLSGVAGMYVRTNSNIPHAHLASYIVALCLFSYLSHQYSKIPSITD
jgi:hypothetical protein